ncbi:MAG: peptidoglycan recognition family protein [Phycisphaeraceae bacterium]
MTLSRRDMLVGSVGLCLAGCSSTLPGPTTYTRRPEAEWPTAVSRPAPPNRVPYTPPARSAVPARASSPYNDLDVVSRSRWTRTGPVGTRVNPMGAIRRLTIHHEGWKPVHFTDAKTTAERLELVRSIHVDRRGWGDLGYHFIIDRAGRVWEGRDIRFQGAHVKDNNEHNIGVMVLGNFDLQRPSDAQLRSLVQTVHTLAQRYRISAHRVQTHQEINPTACPGRMLQPRIASLRAAGYFA